MTDITSTIDTYFETWNETDADKRLALCQRVWSDGGRYVDPILDATGPQAIADGIGALQAQHPGYRVNRTSDIDAHHDRARFGWNITAPDGTVAFAGIDVVELTNDGKLSALTGFIGDMAAVPA